MAEPTTWELMERYNLPCPGSRVVFTFTPGASYASPGEVYEVSWSAGRYASMDVNLSNIENGSGTYDRFTAWQYAEWEYDYTTVERPELKWPRAPFTKRERRHQGTGSGAFGDGSL